MIIENYKPRVFMLLPNDKDTRGAAGFGKLILLFQQDEQRPSIWDSAFVDEAVRRLDLQNYDPDRDYLLVAGMMVPLVAMFTRLGFEYGHVMALCFDMRDNRYIAKRFGSTVDIVNEEEAA